MPSCVHHVMELRVCWACSPMEGCMARCSDLVIRRPRARAVPLVLLRPRLLSSRRTIGGPNWMDGVGQGPTFAATSGCCPSFGHAALRLHLSLCRPRCPSAGSTSLQPQVPCTATAPWCIHVAGWEGPSRQYCWVGCTSPHLIPWSTIPVCRAPQPCFLLPLGLNSSLWCLQGSLGSLLWGQLRYNLASLMARRGSCTAH